MRIYLKHIVLLVAFVATFNSKAQQLPQFSQYMYNTLAINPAYAGSNHVLNLTGLYRNQWVGINGAPVSQTFMIHSPIKNENMGLGLSMINDKIGPSNYTSINTDFSYSIKINEKSKLAFGLKGGINMFQADLLTETAIDQNDIAISENIHNAISPNIGFGMYYHSESFYTGISVPQLLNSTFQTSSSKIYKAEKHAYFIGGLMLPLSNNVKLKPSTMIQLVNGSRPTLNLTTELLIKNTFWAGLGYRNRDAVNFLLGYQITPQIRIGYSYDYTVSKLTTYSKGSHELMLSYDFRFKKNNFKSPRYF